MSRPSDIPNETFQRAVSFCHRYRDASSQEEIVARVLMAIEGQQVRAGLTHQQLATLDFIEKYQAEHRVAPSYDEIKDALGLASKSGVHRLVHGLKERGAIFMLDGRTRSMALRRAA
jgi:repressor LexA